MTFAVGDAVRVSERGRDGHHRTPRYLKGKRGTIERAHGPYRDPETRAYGGSGLPRRELYLVSFEDGADDTRVWADIYEHWLEKAS